MRQIRKESVLDKSDTTNVKIVRRVELFDFNQLDNTSIIVVLNKTYFLFIHQQTVLQTLPFIYRNSGESYLTPVEGHLTISNNCMFHANGLFD